MYAKYHRARDLLEKLAFSLALCKISIKINLLLSKKSQIIHTYIFGRHYLYMFIIILKIIKYIQRVYHI